MKITVFNGSPAGPGSATQAIADAFLRGAASAGAETKTFFLREYSVAHCQGCFSCWFKTPGRCALRDDMDRLLESYRESDVVCFATPVYTWNMTAMLKNFVDRLIPLKCPRITRKQDRFDLQDLEAKAQTFAVISNCGFPGENNFDVLRASMAPCAPALEIYRNCGKLLKSRDPKIEAIVHPWLKSVERAGREMALQREVSADTLQDLKAPLMSTQDYVAWLGMG